MDQGQIRIEQYTRQENNLALRKNLTDPLVLLGFDETGVPVPRLGECG